MADKLRPTYALTCTLHAGRYRWVIKGNGKPIQRSAEAFETKTKARANGLVELVKLIRTSKTSFSLVRPRSPRGGASKSLNG
jgi:hypothetical protein